ncbi:hypothetical protein QJQ45_022971 [Haematococcus lacustris]|nr:hypothetical protein QJQ45_022971 [Haematococcus lacustris]
MGLSSRSHPYKWRGGNAARCACCVKFAPASRTGWVEIHVEGKAAAYRSGQNLLAIGQVTDQMSEVIMACDNLKPALIPLAHRTCAEAAAAAHAVGQRLQGQEPASQLQPMPRLSSTPTQAPAQPGPAHAPCPHHLPDQPPSHPSQLQGSSQHHPALPALLHLPGLSILTRPATNPVTSPAVEQQPIIHTTEEQDEQTMPPSMPKQQQDWATARCALHSLALTCTSPALHQPCPGYGHSLTFAELPCPSLVLWKRGSAAGPRDKHTERMGQEVVEVFGRCGSADQQAQLLDRVLTSPQLPVAVQQAMQQCPTTKQRVACLLLDRVQLLMDSGTCGKKGGQHTDDVTARRVLARLVPPELLEQQLVSAFAQQTGLDRHWVSEAARQNLEQRASIQDRADSLRHFAAVRAPDNRGPFHPSPTLLPSSLPSWPSACPAAFTPSPPSPLPVPPPPSKTQPLSATAMRQLFLCPCELGQQPSLACSLRTCLHCKSRRLQLQPDVDGSVMLTVRQYGKPSSAVGSRPVELLCMRVSLSDAVGMLNKQMPEYIKHHRLAHHQLQVFREHREAVKAGQDGKVVISCDWSEKLTVERSVEIMSEHWHAAQIGILVACAYFKNKEGAYYEQTVYVMTDGKEQSAAITQAAVNQVVCCLMAEHDMDMRQLYMWSDGCAGQFKGAPAMRQHWGMAQRFNVPVWWSYGATAHFKGRHDSEGGVVKQWLRGEILADRVGKCNALGFVQHCNAYHKAATAADPSKAHRARASVGHRWCLELSTQEVGLCSAPQRDAHAFASSIPGSMSMHSCFFPAAGIQVEWSQTACACAQCMTPAPRGECVRPSITKPFVAMPMFDQKRDDKHWDDECLTLLCSFAPDSVMQLCTLGKKLSVKMLNEYCKAVGLCVPANTLRAALRYMVLQHLNEQAECD